jgi:hypothetical protein
VKVIASILFQFGPLLAFVLLNRNRKAGWLRLRVLGMCALATGVSGYVGARYLGLTIYTRNRSLEGENAVGAATIMALVGASMIAAYYLITGGIALLGRSRRFDDPAR